MATKSTAKKKPAAKKAIGKNPPSKSLATMSPEERRRELVDFPSTRELINKSKKKQLLQALQQKGTILGACNVAGVSRTTYYLWTERKVAIHYGLDPDKHYDANFQVACADAIATFGQKVMQTGIDRAIDGWYDEKYDRNGVMMSKDYKYDSSILQMLMKKVDPSLKEKTIEVNNNDNRQQHLTVNGNEQTAKVLDNLTPMQKRLLLKATLVGDKGDDDVIEGEVVNGSDV